MEKFNNKSKDETHELDEQEDKNKGNQLDGVLRDVLSWWENVVFQNTIGKLYDENGECIRGE